MFPEIISALSGTKTAIDIARGLSSLTTDYSVKAKTIDLIEKIQLLHSQLLEIKTRMAEINDEKAEIEKKLSEIEQWENDVAPHYRLEELAPGVFVYAYQHPMIQFEGNEQPAHNLCARCFESRRKSILQKKGYEFGGAILECHECGVKLCNSNDRQQMAAAVAVQPRRKSKWDAFT